MLAAESAFPVNVLSAIVSGTIAVPVDIMNMVVSENVSFQALFTLPQFLAVRAATIQVVVNREPRCLLRGAIHLSHHTPSIKAAIEHFVNMDRHGTQRDSPKGKMSYQDRAGITDAVDNRTTIAAGSYHDQPPANSSTASTLALFICPSVFVAHIEATEA